MYNINLNALSVPPLIDNEMKWQSLNCVQLFGTPRTIVRQASLSVEFSSKNTGVGCHSLLQGIFPTQGSNPGLLHCRQIFLLSVLIQFIWWPFLLYGSLYFFWSWVLRWKGQSLQVQNNDSPYHHVVYKKLFPSKFLHWWLSWFSFPISIWSLLSWHYNVIYLPFFFFTYHTFFFIMVTLLIQLTWVKQGHKLRMAQIWVLSREVILLIYSFQKHFKDLLSCPF